MTDDTQHKLDALYHTGATTIYASRADPRCAYTLYVPHGLARADRSRTTILVSVHGTGRMQSLYRDLFAEFAEYHNCIVLAPLFPAGILGDGNMSGYKFLREQDIRYDEILLDMAGEVAQRYGVSARQLLMFGFSGGGHFTHRFLLLHPERILAASVGAPGVVTLADPERDWWVGTAGAERFLGRSVEPAALAGKAVHFVVGGADRERWEITLEPGDSSYLPGINDAGRDRVERCTALRDSFARWGARTRLDIVAGETHDVTRLVHTTRRFFSEVLAGTFEPDPDPEPLPRDDPQ